MPYAFLAEGQPVEIVPGVRFFTPQLKVAADEAAHYQVPPGTVIDHLTEHAPNALDHYGPADLDRYLIQQFADAPSPPAGQVVASRALSVSRAGVIGTRYTYGAPPVPATVSRLQALLQLAATPSPVHAGKTLLDDVRAAVAASADPLVQAYFEAADPWHRSHASLASLMQALGITATQADALFLAASQRT